MKKSFSKSALALMLALSLLAGIFPMSASASAKETAPRQTGALVSARTKEQAAAAGKPAEKTAAQQLAKKTSAAKPNAGVRMQAEAEESNAEVSNYGDFTGLTHESLNKMLGYGEVVVDASDFSVADIAFLHRHGEKVYGYLNIGSLETYRPYYAEFAGKTLGEYEGWPDERWMDVSDPGWQDYVVNVLAASLKAKGVDGFFLDNLDVFSEYKTVKIFNGVNTIVSRLKQKYGLFVIANGGYDFFTEALGKGFPVHDSVDGVNAESVYTTLAEGNRMTVNSVEERDAAVEYLKNMQAKKFQIYIIEYAKSASTVEKIHDFYGEMNFKVYVSPNVALT